MQIAITTYIYYEMNSVILDLQLCLNSYSYNFVHVFNNYSITVYASKYITKFIIELLTQHAVAN